MNPTQEQIKKDLAAFKKRKSVAPSQQQIQSDIADFRAGKAPSTANAQPGEAVQSKKGFLGNMIADMARLPARGATNLIQAGKEGVNLFDQISGREKRFDEENVQKSPFSGKYLGEVKGIGDVEGGVYSKEGLKDMAGAGLEAASYIPGVKGLQIGGQAIKGAVKTGGRELFKRSIKPLAKEGFKQGLLEGSGRSLQEGDDLGEATAKGVGGGIVSGIAAPLLTGIGSRVGSKVSKTLAKRTKLFPGVKTNVLKEEALNITKPILSKKQQTRAVKGSDSVERSLFGKLTKKATKRDKEVADSVHNIVKKGNYKEVNKDLINTEIGSLDTQTKDLLKTYNPPFNNSQLLKKLNSGKKDLDLVFTSTGVEENTYNKVVNKFINNIKKNNLSGLLDGRQSFDKLPAVQKLLNNESLGENAKREIVTAVRKKANEYIIENAPSEIGEQIRKNLMSQHLMYEARDNIAENIQKELGTDAVDRFVDTRKGRLIKMAGQGMVTAGAIGGANRLFSSVKD